MHLVLRQLQASVPLEPLLDAFRLQLRGLLVAHVFVPIVFQLAFSYLELNFALLACRKVRNWFEYLQDLHPRHLFPDLALHPGELTLIWLSLLIIAAQKSIERCQGYFVVGRSQSAAIVGHPYELNHSLKVNCPSIQSSPLPEVLLANRFGTAIEQDADIGRNGEVVLESADLLEHRGLLLDGRDHL